MSKRKFVFEKSYFFLGKAQFIFYGLETMEEATEKAIEAGWTHPRSREIWRWLEKPPFMSESLEGSV